ncbi:hypothetical protein MCY_00073 [Bartonella rattimassiliensis 15908]|uniref:Uncharacterized protein n=1 Tax=Bartonella rattimassiliensis 15908 TaxID=1094556 RepID=J1JSD1_9HYPH|nr:hypothetical protein MCY_00073 [Bartonella rattimassiliensis 15908]
MNGKALFFRREKEIEKLTYETFHFMLLSYYHHMKLSCIRSIRIFIISLISVLIDFTITSNGMK